MYGSQFAFYGAVTLGAECAAIPAAEYGVSHFGLNWFGYEPQPSEYGLAYFGLNCYGAFAQPPPPSAFFMPGWLIYGRLARPTDPDPLNVNGIWQRRHTKTGIRSVKMKFYTPRNPQTVPQEANRAKFAAAMAAWGELTDSEKAAYNKRAKRLSLLGRNLFVRNYYEANP